MLTAAAPALAHGDEQRAKHHAYDASKAEDTTFGREGDPKEIVRTIQLDMADEMRFAPSDVTITRGQTERFAARHSGKVLHEMARGTADALKAHAERMKKFPEMEQPDPNMTHVKPGAAGPIVWRLHQTGAYQFACLHPGHFEAGMVGKVTAK